MPPLPTGNFPPTTGDDSNAPSSQPALSALRKKWDAQFQNIEAIPSPDLTQSTTSQPVRPIPDLPSLGAEATKAMMSLDNLDAFLTKHQTKTKSNSPSIPTLPTMSGTPASGLHEPTRPVSPAKRIDIPAFPHVDLPDVSLPQAREQLTKPSKKIIAGLVRRSLGEGGTPDLSDLRKTAPQRVKFSPEAPPEKTEPTPEYTDQDLREALQPIINPVVDQFLYKPDLGIHTFLEPMLRSTVRRAIAEQMQDATPFKDISGWDKFAWKLRSLLSSRSYDDIVFDYTRRYQVEEVYLLRPHSRSLISYASHDPARHAKPDKVQATVKKIATKESQHKDEDSPFIKWKDTRNLMIRRGEHCLLAAIVHGPSNAILRADLDYALRQAEERFGDTLEQETDIHIQILQPLLEGCLLIQAPPIPN